MEQGIPVVQLQPTEMPVGMMESAPVQKKVLEPAVTAEVQEAVNNWDKVVSKLSGMVKPSIREGRLTVTGDDKLSIVFTEAINYDTVRREQTVMDIENAISEVIGKSVKLDVKLLEKGEHFEDHFVEIRKKIMIEEIEEEDF